MSSYESLVGWRYLLRRRPNPRILLLGLGLVLVGALVVGAGAWWETRNGAPLSIFGARTGVARALLGGGAGLVTIGACMSLFGLLNLYLTVFGAFSAFMVTTGVSEVILVLGVMNGFQGDLRSKIIDTHAHVMVEPVKHGEHLADYREIAEKARGVEGVLGATPVLRAEVMIKAPTNLSAIVLAGIETGTVGQANKLPQQIKRGELSHLDDPATLDKAMKERGLGRPEPTRRKTPGEAVLDDPEDVPPPEEAPGFMAFPAPATEDASLTPGLFVGAELRRSLALWPGETIDIISPFGELGPDGPIPKSRPFRVAGVFQTEMLEFDSKLAYASLASVQGYLGLGDVAGGVQIRVRDLDEARAVRDRLQVLLGDGVRVTDWWQRNFNLFSALKLEKIAMFLVLTINILLAAFSITSTLVMTIIERRREIAILTAMGSTRAGVVRVFCSQGVFTGVVGAIVGTAIGLGVGYLLSILPLPLDPRVYYISAIPVDVRAVDVVAINLVALLVSLVSTLYPALYAASLRPIEGLLA